QLGSHHSAAAHVTAAAASTISAHLSGRSAQQQGSNSIHQCGSVKSSDKLQQHSACSHTQPMKLPITAAHRCPYAGPISKASRPTRGGLTTGQLHSPPAAIQRESIQRTNQAVQRTGSNIQFSAAGHHARNRVITPVRFNSASHQLQRSGNHHA
ncbi:hypothetical protein Dimus_013918, partial [Dionaea muscipula]